MSENALTAEEMEALKVRHALVEKWGEDTMSTFGRDFVATREPRPPDLLCITTLTVSSTYFAAIMNLLAIPLRMPTKALLRVLFEVSAKVLWCLHKPDTDKSDSAVEERIGRWAKASWQEDIRLRQDYLNLLEGQAKARLENDIRRSEERCKQWKCEPMPRFIKVVKELGDVWYKEHYPQLYRQFNNAVHLDFGSLCGNAKYDGPDLSVTPDTSEPIEDLAQRTVANMHILFLAIRLHYGWSVEEMNCEFQALT